MRAWFVLTAVADAVLPIAKKSVTIGGLRCDGIQTGTVFFPADTSNTYPLLSFVHGWTEGGAAVDGNYKDVLESLAAAGYVVVAEHSGKSNICYPEGKADQLRAIEYVKQTEEFASRVDWNAKVGIYGHSMGADITGTNAADAQAIADHNLGAAVILNPCAAPRDNDWQALLPTFFATGTKDNICDSSHAKSKYSEAHGPMVLAEMADADHFECQSRENFWGKWRPEPHGWTGYVTHWMNCHLKGMSADCNAAFGICDGHPETDKGMADCHMDRGSRSESALFV